jgi:hypothetical protein
MKHLMTFALAAAVLFGLTFTQVNAQDNGGNGKGNQGQVKPNFVDEDGDGICDNNPGNGTGTAVHQRKGQNGQGQGGNGKGNGDCDGTQEHKRLRDGSCEEGGTPAAAPTGKTGTNSASRRKGAGRSR